VPSCSTQRISPVKGFKYPYKYDGHKSRYPNAVNPWQRCPMFNMAIKRMHLTNDIIMNKTSLNFISICAKQQDSIVFENLEMVSCYSWSLAISGPPGLSMAIFATIDGSPDQVWLP